jgi:hypothetical protein
MNILYAGWTNPVSISMPGVPTSALTATLSNGQLIRKGDEWIAIPSPSAINTDVNITVRAKVGEKDIAIQSKFRVKETPKPTAYLVTSNGSKFNNEIVRKGELMNLSGFVAELADLDIPYTVESFEVFYIGPGGDARRINTNSKSFSGEQRALFESINRPNFPLTFKKFVVRGPSGRQTLKDEITVIVRL